MGEPACAVDGDIEAIIEALSLLPPEEREQVLYIAQHPEELRNITNFEEILITSPSEQALD